MMNHTKAARLKSAMRELTRPINGQYPRPWMTSSKDPASSRVFVVGINQATVLTVKDFRSHDEFMAALYNGGPETLEEAYNRIRENGPSRTRQKIDDLVHQLERHGVRDVLETNVICYSTPESSDLEGSSHTGGAARGREIFRTLSEIIEPKVMIVFGSGTVDELEKVLGHHVLKPPTKLPSKPVEARVGQTSVFAIPSLSPRVVNRLGPSLVKEHYEGVCRVVAARLR